MTDFTARRTTMVDTQVRPSDVTKFPIIDAMLSVKREDLVPASARAVAYAEGDIPLGDGRVVLAPRTFAKMLDAAEIAASDVVLDLGCGLGYSSAVLAAMTQAVVAIEPDEDHAREAQANLSDAGVDNAAVVAGSLTEGAAASAPFDVIIVEGGIEQWPEALTDQLRDGGRVIAPWIDGQLGTVRLGRKIDGRLVWRDDFNVHVPVLNGFEKNRAFAL